MTVTGASTDDIGDLAAANGITIHELSLQQASLEAAFMELTHDSVQYRTDTHPHTTAPIREESAA
jgi:ABC-2 type transport system ATP-binding protein